MNHVVLIGNLATDVELKEIDGDRKVATFVLAVDRPSAGDQADFFRVSCWNRQAEVCDRFLARGKLVAVDGRLRSRSWEDAEGKRRSAVEVVAAAVDFLSPRDAGASPSSEEVTPFDAVAA